MRYLTGMHALNLECELNTLGDWHYQAFNWDELTTYETEGSLLKDWGLEKTDKFKTRYPNLPNYKANHFRACLDYILAGKGAYVRGMKDDIICNTKHNAEFVVVAYFLIRKYNLKVLERFMEEEYGEDWITSTVLLDNEMKLRTGWTEEKVR